MVKAFIWSVGIVNDLAREIPIRRFEMMFSAFQGVLYS